MNKKKIILIFLGDFVYDARCINMIESLLDQQYSIQIISEHQNKTISIFSTQIINTFVSLPKNGIYKYIKFHLTIKKLLQHMDFDLLLACDIFSLGAISSFHKNAKLIYDCREIYSQLHAHRNKPIHKYIWRNFEKYFISFIDTVVFSAHSDLNYLFTLYPLLRNKHVGVIKNYPKYFPLHTHISKKNNLTFPLSSTIILYQGVMQKGRGIKKLIHTVNKTKNLCALCIGDGENLQDYICLVDKFNLNEKVFFTGNLPYLEMLQYSSNADIGWLIIDNKSLSNKFALPNKFFEYLLLGLPVLSSDLPNINPIINEYNVGQTALGETLDDLQHSLKIILSNTVNKQDIHEIGKKFTWQKQHNKFIQLIKEGL